MREIENVINEIWRIYPDADIHVSFSATWVSRGATVWFPGTPEERRTDSRTTYYPSERVILRQTRNNPASTEGPPLSGG